MKTRYAKFTTEMGNTVEIDQTIEVVVQLTSQVVRAGAVQPHETIIIPAQYAGTREAVLALRDDAEYKRSQKRGAA